ncbi:MAG: glutathione S-transferase family protein [Thermoleophilaceae bacterium]|nr:glutathione S-transferase family protein [Thermoleophilaceae bacterium]
MGKSLDVIRLYRARFSTNVERVALALAHKGLEVESVVIDYSDRSAVIKVSGQPLVPVIVDDGHVVADSTAILRYLEETRPDPPLFPRDPPRRAELDVFLEWFNEVWKGPPNAIEAQLREPEPDRDRIAALGARMRGWLAVFESMLHDRDYLFGDFSAADCAAFPFLKYARQRDPADDEQFHLILEEHQRLGGGYPRLAAWIERVNERPRA